MTTIFSPAHLQRLAAALSIGAALAGGAVQANGVLGSVRASAQGSAAMFNGSATIIQGSLEILAAGTELIVESVHASADGVVLVLQSASELARITLHVAGNSGVAAVTAAGAVLVVSATAAGHILLSGTQVVAFVPNTVGRPLVHSSYYGDPLHPRYGGNLRHAWVPDSSEPNFNEGE